MKNHLEYIKRSDLIDGTHIRESMYFCKDGKSLIDDKIMPNGFYVSVGPVTMEGPKISFQLFSAKSRLVIAANEYSDEQFDAALAKCRGITSVMSEEFTFEGNQAA